MYKSFQIKTMIKHLVKSSTIKNYLMQIGSILFALADLSSTPVSKKIQILSVLLKEAAENMTCCEENAKGIIHSK